MNMIIRIQPLASESYYSRNILGICASAYYHRLIFGITCYIHISFVQRLYQRGIDRVKQGFLHVVDYGAAILILQVWINHLFDLIHAVCDRNPYINSAGYPAILSFYNAVVQCKISVLITDLQAITFSIAFDTYMGSPGEELTF